ncbi:MAG TPA: FAD-dependent oxidoreductase [Candidatus Hydrogenedens sp.]|nr:FAD-dependent oxidoreductase [Candidatus Hydrogenedens sp.]HOL20359.1 FAD-dependent oxidoreductase [Candidatus Hydrogenedens sp.]
MKRRIIIVGGVAGGMSCATRLKRLDDNLEVIVFEKGSDVSYANCGMPYHIGGIIPDRSSLLVQTVKGLQGRYGLDIRTQHEVISINKEKKEILVKNLTNNTVLTFPYDVLVLATGSTPVIPPIPGADGPNVHVLNHLSDMDKIIQSLETAKHVCVIGAGFIGLELAENLRHRGLDVSLVEMQDHVMPRMDSEMTTPILQELVLNKVNVYLQETAQQIENGKVILKSGKTIESDLACLCVGVRPNSQLAKEAGIDLSPSGHIRVNEFMQTSDPNIYAVGDVVEVKDIVTGGRTSVPLAGPANRQGRITADHICGRNSTFGGIQGTGIVKVFNIASAQTGITEAQAKKLNIDYKKAYVHPMQHPRYYPGAQPVSVKILFRTDGSILGAQVVGSEGVESMINTLAMAIRHNRTVFDLEDEELAYSPQWGGAKHGINMVGYVASNILRGDVDIVNPDDMPQNAYILDVREPDEAEAGAIPNATLIPVDQLRMRVNEIPRDKPIITYCAVGLRGYIAYRFLKQQGFNVYNLNGGFRTWAWFHKKPPLQQTFPSSTSSVKIKSGPADDSIVTPNRHQLDVSGMQCPGPILKVKQVIEKLQPGDILEVYATDVGFTCDVPAWCAKTGHRVLQVRPEKKGYIVEIVKGTTPSEIENTDTACSVPTQKAVTIICFSNDLDRVMAAFVIANGSIAMGYKTTIFFTFWGLNVLRKNQPIPVKKTILEKMFGFMMPCGIDKLKLSKMNMGGLGTQMMKHVMKSKNVMPLSELMSSAISSGVKLVACSMTMDIMGIKKEELIDNVEIGGVGYYLGEAGNASVNLFV